jgi:hypothetical protein
MVNKCQLSGSAQLPHQHAGAGGLSRFAGGADLVWACTSWPDRPNALKMEAPI